MAEPAKRLFESSDPLWHESSELKGCRQCGSYGEATIVGPSVIVRPINYTTWGTHIREAIQPRVNMRLVRDMVDPPYGPGHREDYPEVRLGLARVGLDDKFGDQFAAAF